MVEEVDGCWRHSLATFLGDREVGNHDQLDHLAQGHAGPLRDGVSWSGEGWRGRRLAVPSGCWHSTGPICAGMRGRMGHGHVINWCSVILFCCVFWGNTCQAVLCGYSKMRECDCVCVWFFWTDVRGGDKWTIFSTVFLCNASAQPCSEEWEHFFFELNNEACWSLWNACGFS